MIAAIGNRLKEAREKKAISLDEVHAKIKIHPRILQILEEDKFDKLPSPLFAKSFLRNYADFLEVNTDEIMDAYDKQGKKDAPEQALYIKTADEKIKEAQGFQNIGTILAFVLAAFLCGAALFYVAKNFQGWSEALAGKAAAGRSSSAKEAKQASKADKPVSGASALPSSEWLRSPAAGNFPKISPKHSLDLKIRALDNVWLHVTCDGKVLFQSILKKGAVESWSAEKSLQVWSGNASSMSLTLNNTQLGSPGKGSVKKIAITHEGVKAIT